MTRYPAAPLSADNDSTTNATTSNTRNARRVRISILTGKHVRNAQGQQASAHSTTSAHDASIDAGGQRKNRDACDDWSGAPVAKTVALP